MPGLNQLKKFTSDIRTIGNEIKIRSERGEPIEQISLPSNISEEDDSEDFIFGLPTPETLAITQKKDSLEDDFNALNSQALSDDFSGEIDPDVARLLGNFSEPEEKETAQSGDAKDLDDLFAPEDSADKEAENTNAALDGIDTDEVQDITPLESFEENPVDSLKASVNAGLPADDSISGLPVLEPQDEMDSAENLEPLEELDNFDSSMAELDSYADSDLTNAGSELLNELENTPGAETNNTENFDLSDVEELPELDELDEPDDSSNDATSIESGSNENFAEPEAFNLEDIPEEENRETFEEELPSLDYETEPAAEINESGTDNLKTDDINLETSLPDFDNADFDNMDFSFPDFEEKNETQPAAETAQTETNDSLADMSLDEDIEGFGSSTIPVMTDDEMLDSIDSASPSLSALDDFTTTDGQLQNDDSIDDSDFNFDEPDLQDFETNSKKSTGIVSGKEQEEKRDSLSDAEYELFKKNLAEYPLNLRIAIEELIVKNEFTDDAVYGVIEKILKRVSARQLAIYIDKYLDIQVDVPRDFERRTSEQYEIYKQSLQYQLKNRVIPAFIAGVFLLGFIALFSYIGAKYVYRPLAAETAYKEGYALLEESMYQQSEMKFNYAVSLKAKKNWFFKYARGFRDAKQYDRARTKYQQLLKRFNHDKFAGLEYAMMEFTELENYPAAENVLKREVLDYHINDKDAMLMLGDVYLEWATEQDEEKFKDTLHQYNDVIQMHGNSNAITARLMSYYIRTDQLKEVLPLKNYFYTNKKAIREANLVELSGYLLDKLHGYLPPSQEYLRAQITDVRDLLEKAIETEPESPEAFYNMGRYFVLTDNVTPAIKRLETALVKFEKVEKRKKARVYRHINTYNLLGELQCKRQEFILAEEFFGKGIELFENEEQHSNLKPSADVGKLYANLADIDYFISGDYLPALQNYERAISYGYSTPQIQYKVGYINYTNGEYEDALDAFLNAASLRADDTDVLLALANTFALRDNISSAYGYYSKLLELLDGERSLFKIISPQTQPDHYKLVSMYMKTSNNIGVMLSRLAQRSGNSSQNAKAMVQFSEANRAWDSLTRNQKTMVRLEGSNLAAQNMKYLTSGRTGYKPEIYTDIDRKLSDEPALSQDLVQ